MLFPFGVESVTWDTCGPETCKTADRKGGLYLLKKIGVHCAEMCFPVPGAGAYSPSEVALAPSCHDHTM